MGNSAQLNRVTRRARQNAMSDILNKLTRIAVSFGVVAMAASAYRINSFGWHPNIACDFAAFSIITALLLLRHKLPLQFVVPSLIAAVGASTVLNYLTLGLVTIGPVMLAAVCVIAGIFYGQRRGLIVVMASLCVLAGIAAADVAGLLPRLQNTAQYVHSSEAWIAHLFGGGLYITVALVTVGSVHERLKRALARLKANSIQLQSREEKYRLLSETMRDVLFVQDKGSSLTFVSPSVRTVFGYTPEEFLKLGPDVFMTPESYDRALKDCEKAFVGAEQGLLEMPLLEYEYIRKNGTTFWGEVRLSFIRDASGNIGEVQGILRDISARKAAQEENALLSEQLRQSEKLRAIGQLAGGIAHDFNNQLSGISAYASLIQAHYFGDSRLKGYVEGILTATKRANDLTDKLLDYARKEPARSVLFDMDTLITEVSGILEHSVGNNIVIETVLEATSTTLRGDPTQIQSALLNLALNARDAMPDGGTIEICTKNVEGNNRSYPIVPQDEKTKPRILLTVSDTGSGIDEEHLPRIFEPFFTTKSAGQGTGMGLATVHSAVEAHGGAVSVKSIIGRGTRFSISLPIVPCQSPKQVGSLDAGVFVPDGGDILLVDDEEVVRRTAGLMLEQLGYRVTAASNAEEAISAFETGDFCMVLLDVCLPGCNGLDIYAALEHIDPEVRVVLMSGYSAGLDADEIIETKSVPFLAKPFSCAELKSRISEAMTPSSPQYGHF